MAVWVSGTSVSRSILQLLGMMTAGGQWLWFVVCGGV